MGFARLLLLFAVYAAVAITFAITKPTWAQSSVTGVIDGISFEGGQYFAQGWACQRGQRVLFPPEINLS